MPGNRKKKYETGEGAKFLSRRAALKKLQLSLSDFRRLCVLKGIYPREPRNRKRAQKGVTDVKTLYHIKDIQFLMHEPIIWKLRDYKIFNRRVGKARAIRDFRAMRRYLNNHPTLKLDHIVKERYPTFLDALRDLDDCLTLCFLFSTFPSLPHIPRSQFDLCQRLTVEFLHVVIEAKALRKVFVSIKGYYYQIELKGETITWICPHHFGYQAPNGNEVDFKLMSTFVEFYVILLGFVNFRLYHLLNLQYPPMSILPQQTIGDEQVLIEERVNALNTPLMKTAAYNMEPDQIPLDTFGTTTLESVTELQQLDNLKCLFKNCKFYLNREVPHESLVFVIRCCGGSVSWDKETFIGATYGEEDETITHQIVDRPTMEKQFISRYYIQPQWIYDSINARELLTVSKYFMGAVLPPHLSPFVDKDAEDIYQPPEAEDLAILEQIHREDVGEMEVSKHDEITVTPGQIHKEPEWKEDQRKKQEHRLREKMVKPKHRRIYKAMKLSQQNKAREVWLLKKKRRLYEEQQKSNSGQK